MRHFEICLKKNRRFIWIDIAPVPVSFYYRGVEGPKSPYFMSLTIGGYEFGVDKELLSHEYDDELVWDRYRAWKHNLTTGEMSYFPKKG